MKIVILDAYHINPGDLTWDSLLKFGDVVVHQNTLPGEVIERARGAEVILSNKVVLDSNILNELPDLRYIGVMATGYNNIDIKAAKEKGIVVTNVAGYSTQSVNQHVFAGILALLNKVEGYSEQVKAGRWKASGDWTFSIEPMLNLEGMKMGLLGFGKIGQQVARTALSFGMEVIAFHKYPERDAKEGIDFVDLEVLFSQADILSLHVPLNDGTQKIVNAASLALMKNNAILVNTGRGGLIDENALYNSLINHRIKAAFLDVLTEEPPGDNPLFQLENCLVTPHIAWAGRNARKALIEILADNISAYLSGRSQNRIV